MLENLPKTYLQNNIMVLLCMQVVIFTLNQKVLDLRNNNMSLVDDIQCTDMYRSQLHVITETYPYKRDPRFPPKI